MIKSLKPKDFNGQVFYECEEGYAPPIKVCIDKIAELIDAVNRLANDVKLDEPIAKLTTATRIDKLTEIVDYIKHEHGFLNSQISTAVYNTEDIEERLDRLEQHKHRYNEKKGETFHDYKETSTPLNSQEKLDSSNKEPVDDTIYIYCLCGREYKIENDTVTIMKSPELEPYLIKKKDKTREDYWTPKEPVCDTPPNDKMFCEWTYKQVPVDKEWHSLMMSVKRDTEDNFSVKNVVILSDDYIDELVPLYKHNEVITQMIKYREVIQEVYQLAKENNKGLCSASSACETIRSKLKGYIE